MAFKTILIWWKMIRVFAQASNYFSKGKDILSSSQNMGKRH